MNIAVRVTLALVGFALGVVAVLELRDATLSTHDPVPRNSRIELVVAARTKGGEPHQTLDEMVEAQLLTCRLEVRSDLVGAIEHEGNNRYRAVFTPSMDETNRREFRGCLEDWIFDHFLLDVLHLAEV
jgi:hypothetical protein